MKLKLCPIIIILGFLFLEACSGGGGGAGQNENQQPMVAPPVASPPSATPTPSEVTGNQSSANQNADITPPVITSTSPQAGAEGVELNSPVTVTFSKPISRDSVTATVFTLQGPSGPISGTATLNDSGQVLTFQPSTSFVFSRIHTAIVSNQIRDLAGNALATPLNWNFTTTSALNASRTTADQAQLATSANGSAIVVWRQGGNLYASRFTSESGWGQPVHLNNRENFIEQPQIAIAPDGNAVAIWRQNDGTTYRILSAYYNVATNGWGEPTPINSPVAGDLPMVAAGGDGSFMAVWLKTRGGVGPIVVANRHPAGGGWGTEVPVSSGIPFGTTKPKISVGGDGSAIAVWMEGANSVYANRFLPATGWGSPVSLQSAAGWAREEPQIVVGRDGEGVATWAQFDARAEVSSQSIYARRFEPATGWELSPTLLENNTFAQARGPQAVLDSAGNAMVVWYQALVQGQPTSIWFNRALRGGSWASEGSLVEQGEATASVPQISAGPLGFLFAVWKQGNDIVGSVYRMNSPDSGTWGAATTIDTLSSYANDPKIAVLPSGVPLVIWIQSDGANNRLFTGALH